MKQSTEGEGKCVPKYQLASFLAGPPVAPKEVKPMKFHHNIVYKTICSVIFFKYQRIEISKFSKNRNNKVIFVNFT